MKIFSFFLFNTLCLIEIYTKKKFVFVLSFSLKNDKNVKLIIKKNTHAKSLIILYYFIYMYIGFFNNNKYVNTTIVLKYSFILSFS
jgi:hypothetical protein